MMDNQSVTLKDCCNHIRPVAQP